MDGIPGDDIKSAALTGVTFNDPTKENHLTIKARGDTITTYERYEIDFTKVTKLEDVIEVLKMLRIIIDCAPTSTFHRVFSKYLVKADLEHPPYS